MKNHKKRGLLASAGALATAVALVLGGAAVASAAPTINPSGTVNLNITKLSTPDGSAGATDGTNQTGSLPAGADPIANVEFTVQRVQSYVPSAGGAPVQVDLTTNAGWLAAQVLGFDAATGTWHDGIPFSGANQVTVTFDPNLGGVGVASLVGVTNAAGVPQTAGNPSFQGMPIGLYHVEETAQPAGVTPAVPFIVALPLTNPAGNDWMNTVYVYPKNSQVGFTKSVNDAAAYVPGNTVSYALHADVPRARNAAGTAWIAPTQFAISDTIDARLTPGAVTVNIVDAAGNNLGTQPVAGTDYTVSAAGASPVTVAFQGSGFTLLQTAAATAGAQVRVTIVATVGAAPAGAPAPNGDIANGGATTTLNFTVDGEASALTANTVLSKWRNVNFTKVAAEDTDEELAGAVFALFATKTNAAAGTSPLATSAATLADGVVNFSNIRVSDWQNGSAQTVGAKANPLDADCTVNNTAFRVYWLAETVAPANRELLAEPLAVVIDSAGVISTIAVDGSGNPVVNADCSGNLTTLSQVKNVAKNAGFQLPLTGGMGTAILTIGGIAILAVVMLFVVRSRRNDEAAE